MVPSAPSTTAPPPYSHSVLFAELSDSELVHAGGQVLHGLVQVLGVTLHQRLRDPTAAVLQKTPEEGSATASGIWRETQKGPSKNGSVFVEPPGARAPAQLQVWFSLAGVNFGECEAGNRS